MIHEKIKSPSSVVTGAFHVPTEEASSITLKGKLHIVIQDTTSGEILEDVWISNLIVTDASILVARLLANNTEPPYGLFALAVGTGDVGWDPLNPPAPTVTQRALYAEIARKTFSSVQFVDSVGVPVAYPTRTVDFTAVFTESEAVGPLMEMGLIGGNVSSNLAIKNPVSPPNGPYDPTVDLTLFESLFNYLPFAMINKPPTATMALTWRISA